VRVLFHAWHDITTAETVGEPVTFHIKINAHVVAFFLFASSVGLIIRSHSIGR